MNPCVFCEGAKGEQIYEDENTYAILDINPISSGHTLIIPKVHIVNLDENALKKSISAMMKIKEILDKKYHPDGYNLLINNGSVAGQEIMHLHIHLIPRYRDQKLKRGVLHE